MFRRIILLTAIVVLSTISIMGQQQGKGNLLLSTKNTSMLLDATPGKPLRFAYYGDKITLTEIEAIYASLVGLNKPAYPAFGSEMLQETALQVVHSDGNPTLNLIVKDTQTLQEENGSLTIVTLSDSYYPFQMKVYYRTREKEDVIEQWTEISHTEKKSITLNRFDSAYMPIRKGNVWISHLNGGAWGSENNLVEEQLTHGMKSIKTLDGARNGRPAQAQVMFSLDGRPNEQTGRVIGASLSWSGNFELRIDTENKLIHHFFIGMHNLASNYRLDPKEIFETPKVIWTYSDKGVGGASRNYHQWARSTSMHGGNKLRDVLLNSWEGVTFNVNETAMHTMIDDISALGGELFVMDDGWFGDKYPRNTSSTSLGDWVVDKRKLPNGIEGLVNKAKSKGVKFGIWIEPEAVNTKSELYEKHPDWALQAQHRDFNYGRGGTQLLLDLTNPAVQDHAFAIVDNLMTANPNIAYFKWDANVNLRNYGSTYLSEDKQTNLYIDYHRGLEKVLKRIRNKYPDVVMQACGGGGGRICYGLLPYFDEFWVSDNTDALQRIFIQWGTSYFYPSMSMAQHVGVQPNYQTGRTLPLKLRFDVAMTGRMGLELLPSHMTDAEKEYSTATISEYKRIRPIVQLGDQYRLISPYSEHGVASMMSVSPEKDRAVFFVYKLVHYYNQTIPRFRMEGLDPMKKYRIREISVLAGYKTCLLHDQSFMGAFLMNEGVEIELKDEYASRVLEIIAE